MTYAALARMLDHRVERVDRVGVRVVGVDRDDLSRPRRVLPRASSVDALLPREHVGAVVARLDEDETGASHVLGERVVAPVDAREVEWQVRSR